MGGVREFGVSSHATREYSLLSIKKVSLKAIRGGHQKNALQLPRAVRQSAMRNQIVFSNKQTNALT